MINGVETTVSPRATATTVGTAARAMVSAAGPRWATLAVGPTAASTVERRDAAGRTRAKVVARRVAWFSTVHRPERRPRRTVRPPGGPGRPAARRFRSGGRT